MSQTYSYQIGILYFAGNIKSIRNILVKMLKADGYRVGVWTMDETADNAENSVDLYNFIRNQCEHTVLFVTPECSEKSLFEQAVLAQIQLKNLDDARSFLVIECGKKLLPEYKKNAVCLDGRTACSAELAMQIEEFFYPKQMPKKDLNKTHPAQNIVFADVIQNSKFF